MSEFLAIHLENGHVCAVDAHVGKGHVRVHGGLQIQRPEALAEATPLEIGHWLKEELHRAGFGGRQVVVTLPREDCIVRRLDLPDAPDEELPDLVRLQAATVSATPLERALLDFLPLPRAADAPGRSVLMVTILKERAEQIRAMLQAAGLELVSIGISPAATTELVARAQQRRGDDPHQPALVLVRQSERVEISLVRERQLIFTHSTDLIGDCDADRCQFVLPEISRVLVMLENQLGGARLGRGWVVGTPDDDEALRDAVASRFGCELEFLDPLGDPGLKLPGEPLPGGRALYAAPCGALLQAAGAAAPVVNFLSPRRPPVKKDHSRYRVAAVAASVLLLGGIGYGLLWMEQADLDKAIAERQQQERDLDDILKKGEPVLAAAESVEDWTHGRIDWLDQLQQIHKLLPGAEDVYLTDFRVSPATGDALARIRATGYARERRHVETLYGRLAAGPYRVRPHEIKSDKRDSKYTLRFEVDMDLLAGTPAPSNAPGRAARSRNLTAQTR